MRAVSTTGALASDDIDALGEARDGSLSGTSSACPTVKVNCLVSVAKPGLLDREPVRPDAKMKEPVTPLLVGDVVCCVVGLDVTWR